MAYLVDTRTLEFVWGVVVLIGILAILGCVVLAKWDQKEYPLLYSRKGGLQ